MTMLTTLLLLLVLVPGHAHRCPGYHAHPEDCAQFYRCDARGSTHLFRCPAGTRFDPSLGLCNHQHLVMCDQTSKVQIPTATARIPTSSTMSSTATVTTMSSTTISSTIIFPTSTRMSTSKTSKSTRMSPQHLTKFSHHPDETRDDYIKNILETEKIVRKVIKDIYNTKTSFWLRLGCYYFAPQNCK